MNSVTQMLAEVAEINLRLERVIEIADKTCIEHIDLIAGMLNRAENLLLNVEQVLSLAGAPVELVLKIRQTILDLLDAQIQASDHRAMLVATAAIEQARRNTLH